MDLPLCVIKEIVEWIDTRLDQPLRIEDVARYSGYSKRHLQRLFFQHESVSLGEYIRERKMQCAARDLRETMLTIRVIGCRYGYSSQQIFTRIFTRRFSMAPGLYRKYHYLRENVKEGVDIDVRRCQGAAQPSESLDVEST